MVNFNIVCNPKENSINITMFPFVLTTNTMLFSRNKFLSRLFDRYIDENKITSFDVALFWMINAITKTLSKFEKFNETSTLKVFSTLDHLDGSDSLWM